MPVAGVIVEIVPAPAGQLAGDTLQAPGDHRGIAPGI
jgi:hypothetical protein